MRKRQGQSGFSFLEVLIAGTIFGLIMMALLSAMRFLGSSQSRVRAATSEDRTIAGLINNIRANLHQYQMIYAPEGDAAGDAKREELLATLPLAFNDSVVVPEGDCPECPGRLGVVIQPSRGLGDLFVVTIRLTHQTLYSGGFKEYRFLSAFK